MAGSAIPTSAEAEKHAVRSIGRQLEQTRDASHHDQKNTTGVNLALRTSC